ncbi:MAG: PEP-CTERM sorting domain-containing protein [Cyanobacteriota bacterium]|nr:PEP-CTERM sorting domain-containing protein [Cyanobacteriota bacterium]
MKKRHFSFLIASATAILSLGSISEAKAITYRLDWTGQTLGYSAEGFFSYDETQSYEDRIVREENLDSFDISFFDPGGNLIQSFPDNYLTLPDFNFNFDISTGEILQEAAWDEPEGLNIGGVRGEGLNLWSIPDSKVDLFPDGEPSPHIHLTDWGEEFPDLPIGFTGMRSHLDIAFFTRTTAEILNDPTAPEEFGQKLTATKVPEPSTISVLLGFGAIAIVRSTQTRKRKYPSLKQ